MANLKDLIVNGPTRLNSDVTIGGKTTLGGAPTSDNEAATKKYVDDSIPSVPSPADATPLMDGTAAVGTSTDYAREDHVHPSDTAKVTKVASTTDNAVVRFDGTSGAIQNSGVTVDDNGYLTASKIIKSGGTSSQFLKADGSVDTNTYLTSQVNSDWNATSGAAEILNKPTIPAAANSGKMKISANSSSAVDTLFNANSSADTNAIKFIDGTNTQVTVTAASGSTPATVKYDIPSTATPSITSIEASYSDTTNNLSGYRGMLAKKKVYTGVLGVANGSAPYNNTRANRTVYFLTVHPKSFDSQWTIHYRLNIHLDDENQLFKSSSTASTINLGRLCRGTYDCILHGNASTVRVYHYFQSVKSTSYYPIYFHMFHGPTQAGFDEGYKIGVDFYTTYNTYPVTDYSSGTAVANTKYSRTIEVTVDECVNCTAELNETLEIEADAYTANDTNGFKDYVKLNSTYYTTSTTDSNSEGRWTAIGATTQGLHETSDSDTYSYTQQTYNYLKNGTQYEDDSSGYFLGYNLIGFDKDGKALAISKSTPTTTSYSSSANINRVYCDVGFDYTKGIRYYNSSGNFQPDADMNISTQINYSGADLRYSDNCLASTGAQNSLGMVSREPVYLRGTIGSDGFFYLAPIEVTYNNATYKRAWVQPVDATRLATNPFDTSHVYWFIGYPQYNSSYANSLYQLNLISTGGLNYYDGTSLKIFSGGIEWGTW